MLCPPFRSVFGLVGLGRGGVGGGHIVQGGLHGAAQVVFHADLCLADGVLDGLGLGRAVGLDDRLPRPRKGAPPYSSLSICFFSSATLPFIIRPASLPVVLE